jgi:hypothetical protein
MLGMSRNGLFARMRRFARRGVRDGGCRSLRCHPLRPAENRDKKYQRRKHAHAEDSGRKRRIERKLGVHENRFLVPMAVLAEASQALHCCLDAAFRYRSTVLD